MTRVLFIYIGISTILGFTLVFFTQWVNIFTLNIDFLFLLAMCFLISFIICIPITYVIHQNLNKEYKENIPFEVVYGNTNLLIAYGILFIIILLILIIYVCNWILVFLFLFLPALIYYLKYKNLDSLQTLGFIVLLIITLGVYPEIKVLFEDYNQDFSSQAYELGIENEMSIQLYYKDSGYRPMWIGRLSDKVYVRASKYIQFPCCDTGRYDLFTINGKHLRELKTYEEIPKVKFKTTTQDGNYLFLLNDYR